MCDELNMKSAMFKEPSLCLRFVNKARDQIGQRLMANVKNSLELLSLFTLCFFLDRFTFLSNRSEPNYEEN